MPQPAARSKLAEQLVWKVRHDLEILDDETPPRHVLGSIARWLKVQRGSQGLATNDGYTCRTSDGGFQVVVNGELTTTRAAFTLAHELGHMIAEKYDATDPAGDVERLCDAIASRILLPTPWIRDMMPEGDTSLVDLLAVACSANVSPFSVALRMNEEGHRICLFRIKQLQASKRWLIATAIGMSHSVRRSFVLAETTAKLLDELDGQPVTRVAVELATENERFMTTGEVCVDGGGANLRVDLVLRGCRSGGLAMKTAVSDRTSVILDGERIAVILRPVAVDVR